jgi:hypothetical protein
MLQIVIYLYVKRIERKGAGNEYTVCVVLCSKTALRKSGSCYRCASSDGAYFYRLLCDVYSFLICKNEIENITISFLTFFIFTM